MPFVFKDLYSCLFGFFLKDLSYVENHFIDLKQSTAGYRTKIYI